MKKKKKNWKKEIASSRNSLPPGLPCDVTESYDSQNPLLKNQRKKSYDKNLSKNVAYQIRPKINRAFKVVSFKFLTIMD